MTGSGGTGEADTCTGRFHHGRDGQRQLAGWDGRLGLGLTGQEGQLAVEGGTSPGSGRLLAFSGSCSPLGEAVVLK